jgi:hypothetical protein
LADKNKMVAITKSPAYAGLFYVACHTNLTLKECLNEKLKQY